MVDRFVRALVIACLAHTLVMSSSVCVAAAQSVAAGTAIERAPDLPMVTVHVDTVPLKVALQQIALQAGLTAVYSDQVAKANNRVTLHMRHVSVEEAFQKALMGTGLRASVVSGNVLFEPEDEVHTQAGGIVTGVVLDSRTRGPVRGATVTVDDATKGVVTGDDGAFRIGNVSAGAHLIHARLLGYVKGGARATVPEDGTIAIEIMLAPSVNTLDQVVVTGTVIPTERKAIPNAITVITAKDIEQRGITHIDQLFRGDVPGLFAQNQGSSASQPGRVAMSSRGNTYLPGELLSNQAGATVFSQPIKTYVDGIELADPSYLGLIDPKSIERIEIIPGPQASTIYGANAINGVMQIFTKRGTTSRPQLAVTLLSGVIQNNFSAALAPQHDYSVQINGVDGHISYNAGGSWVYVGPWTPSVHQATTSGFGGVRFQQGPLTADVSLRTIGATNWLHGGIQQTIAVGRRDGTFGGVGFSASENGVDVPMTTTSTAQTLGVSITYVPTSWWSHTLTGGADVTNAGLREDALYSLPRDTLLLLSQNDVHRTSLSYISTLRVPITSGVHGNVTFGADGWQSLTSTLTTHPTSLTGTLTTLATVMSRLPSHDAGAFMQGQIGFGDALFLTYGLRSEWNPTFGADANPNLVGRYGAAYTRAIGPLTAKLRGSYGHSTRPPIDGLTAATLLAQVAPGNELYFGDVPYRLANPHLLPEQQQGGEGGLELYFGNRVSLVVTRYNQTVNNLITEVVVDSVDLLPAYRLLFACNPWQCPQHQFENLNIGNIRNQGWELQGTVSAGPITTTGTYSWTKSRLIGITPRYQALFPQYVKGATFQSLPEHTYALDLQYTSALTTVSLNFQGQGALYSGGDALTYQVIDRRLDNTAPLLALPVGYVSRFPGYTSADLNVARRFSAYVEGVLQVHNLTDAYRNDASYQYASIGRQTKAGIRIRW